MKIRTRLLIPLALLGILFLMGSASAAVDFPADEAGISAYVHAKPSGIDLNSAKSAFSSIERETPDYIIGTVALYLHAEEEYPHVYVSTDGWVVAYYPNERPSSWILPWAYYSGGAVSSTTLSKAVGQVATAVGGTSSGVKYYDFRYEDANKMMIITESIQHGTNFFKFTIPTTFQTYAVDWSHYNKDEYTSNSNYGKSYAYLNGVSISYLATTDTNYGSFTGQVQNGVEQIITIKTDDDATGRVGLVLEYAE